MRPRNRSFDLVLDEQLLRRAAALDGRLCRVNRAGASPMTRKRFGPTRQAPLTWIGLEIGEVEHVRKPANDRWCHNRRNPRDNTSTTTDPHLELSDKLSVPVLPLFCRAGVAPGYEYALRTGPHPGPGPEHILGAEDY